MSLHTLYGSGDTHTLADGVNPEVYDEPLFNGKSAAELLREKHNNSEEAEAILRNHVAYASTAMDEETGAFPGSRDFLVGVIDSRAVQTRADTAVRMAKERIASRPEQFTGRELVCASLACGSAGPVYELARSLSENGTRIGKLILVDNDPMALASAISLARSQGVEDRIEYHRKNLFRNNLTSYMGRESVDFVDLLGLIDYFPVEIPGNNGKVHYPLKALLEDVRNVMRPGGMVLVGNMLNKRPQQRFFEKVWPNLQQRGIREMLSIIASAGYDPSKVQVRIPGREGVYAIYGIPIPEANTDQIDSPQHRLGKWAVNQLQY
jgi:predicted O-methyltransferase YrrM